MISIRRSKVYRLWTIYIFGRSIAGLAGPAGVWAGPLMIVIINKRPYVVWTGRWTLS